MVLSAEPAEDAHDAGFSSTSPVPYVPSSSTRNPFPPIADYAFLSDCENTCLISSSGSVEWLCVPRPDSPSVFGAILDRSAGHFRIGPLVFSPIFDERPFMKSRTWMRVLIASCSSKLPLMWETAFLFSLNARSWATAPV